MSIWSVILDSFDVLICCPFNLTRVVDLPGVKVIQEGHHQALAQVDLHQGHCHILTALDRGHLLHHGQSTAILHLLRGWLRLWAVSWHGTAFIIKLSTWISVLRRSCEADLCRGDDWLNQKVNERLIVHRWKDPILHQTHLQTQRSQLATASKGKYHRISESSTVYFLILCWGKLPVKIYPGKEGTSTQDIFNRKKKRCFIDFLNKQELLDYFVFL